MLEDWLDKELNNEIFNEEVIYAFNEITKPIDTYSYIKDILDEDKYIREHWFNQQQKMIRDYYIAAQKGTKWHN
jgi:hypothetical protein